MKSYIHLTLVLLIIGAISGTVIGLLNEFTAPIIQDNNEKKIKAGISEIFEVVDTYEDLSETLDHDYEAVYKVLDVNQEVIGYVIYMEAPKAYDTIDMLIGIDTEGNAQGVAYVTVKETRGIGDRVTEEEFKVQFEGISYVDATRNSETKNVDTLSGATVSSTAVVNAVKEALAYYNENLTE